MIFDNLKYNISQEGGRRWTMIFQFILVASIHLLFVQPKKKGSECYSQTFSSLEFVAAKDYKSD